MKIEKDIAIPPRKGKRGYAELIAKMVPGDSILFSGFKDARSFSALMRAKKLGCSMREEGKKFRVWLVRKSIKVR